MSPEVSVIMPVYNGEKYLNESIDSILTQTFKNFEFIIINDGSTDNCLSLISEYKDDRIIIIDQMNKGLACSLNTGIELSKGKYIARQDQDDISLPNRLARQVTFFDDNSDYAMVGTWAKIFSEGDIRERYHKHPTEYADILSEMIFDNPFVHSSVMIRRSVFSELGGYSIDITRQPPEDYELWSRIVKKYKVANIPEILLQYREIPSSMSRDKNNSFDEKVFLVSMENLAHYSSTSIDNPAIYALAMLTHNVSQNKNKLVPYRMIKKILKKLKMNIITFTDNIPAFNRKWEVVNSRILNNYLKLKYNKKLVKLLSLIIRFSRLFINARV